MANSPLPTNINLHQKSRLLEIEFNNGDKYEYSCHYLRCFSPSAEVQGHAPGQEVLQVGKINIGITKIESVGNYALQLFFSDDHDSGLFSWNYLYEQCSNQEAYWQDYLNRLTEAGAVDIKQHGIIPLCSIKNRDRIYSGEFFTLYDD